MPPCRRLRARPMIIALVRWNSNAGAHARSLFEVTLGKTASAGGPCIENRCAGAGGTVSAEAVRFFSNTAERGEQLYSTTTSCACGLNPTMSSTDISNRILSRGDGGGGGSGVGSSTTLSLSPGARGDGDKKALGALVVVGLSLAGALAFAYTRPADNKW